MSTRSAKHPPHSRRLTALRIEATVLMSLAIGQAGLAAGFLGGDGSLEPVHGINAYALIATTVVVTVTAVLYRRTGGPPWPILAGVILLLVETGQLVLASLDAVGLHIFSGVLFVVMATLLTSYLFRPGFVSPAGISAIGV